MQGRGYHRPYVDMDSRNRLLSETKTVDGAEYTMSYAYDAVSHLISTIYPDGTVVEQTYDNVGRVTSVNGYAEYLWNETQLQHITYANGVTTDYSYDARGRPTQIHTQKNGGDLLNLTYTYDVIGNILQMKNTENVNGQQIIKEQWDYTYDSLNRLRTAVGNSYSFTYMYDSAGNRTQLNNTQYTYNEMNELTSIGGEDSTFTFEYDEYGNCIEKSDGIKTWEYMYDYENRLTAVKVDGVTTEEYLYDGDGNRIKKTDSSSERIYIYSGMNVLYEVNTTTQMHAVYVYGPTGRIAKKVNDIAEYYHEDHLGSTRLVTTENGVVTEEIMYEPFGEEINAPEERYTFNGKEEDETGLYYYGARYYDPAIGRFISRDPVTGKKEAPQTLNRYVYCLDNPLTYVDPTGNESEDPVMDTFNNIDWSIIDWEKIQALIDANDLFGALVELVTELIAQGLPFDFVRDSSGTITNIVYRETGKGGVTSHFEIGLATPEELVEKADGNTAAAFGKAAFIVSSMGTGIWLNTTSCFDAKGLANSLLHESIHAHDYFRAKCEGKEFNLARSEMRAYWWTMKNYFKMRWPF